MRLKQYRCSELFRHKPWKASCGLGMWTLEKAYVGVGSGLLKVSSPGGHWLPGLLFAFLLSVLFLLTWCILTSARACPGRKDTCGASRFLYLSPTTESDSGDLKIISWVIPEVPLGEPPAGVGLRGQPGPRMFAKVPERKWTTLLKGGKLLIWVALQVWRLSTKPFEEAKSIDCKWLTQNKMWDPVQFSCSVMSDSLQPCGLQHARSPCPSPIPEFTQTHVRDAIQSSHPLSSRSPPAFNLSQHYGLFKWVSSSHQEAKVLEFQLQHQSFQWTFRTDFL